MRKRCPTEAWAIQPARHRKHSALMVIPLPKPQDKMFLIDHSRLNNHRFDGARKKDRLRVSVTKGFVIAHASGAARNLVQRRSIRDQSEDVDALSSGQFLACHVPKSVPQKRPDFLPARLDRPPSHGRRIYQAIDHKRPSAATSEKPSMLRRHSPCRDPCRRRPITMAGRW